MKKFLTLVIFFNFFTIMVYSEAPELKNVMPNSWRKVTRLTAEEEKCFISKNQDIIEQIKILHNDSLQKSNCPYFEPKYFIVYKQIAGADIFYRIIVTDIEKTNFLSSHVHFIQHLVYKSRLICKGFYNIEQQNHVVENVFLSIDIIMGKNNIKGILLTSCLCDKTRNLKGQLKGLTGSNYFLIENIDRNIDTKETYVIQNCSNISIYASDCLVDPNIPLRYSLQNAFDGDPSTSYVENTEDDLMRLKFSGEVLPKIIKLAIINGYAQNRITYNNNNRIKKISSLGNEKILNDGLLSYQFMTENAELSIWVKEIYRGEKYNDTCLGELNFLTDHGWLFGEINE